jgi:hypothetical protein
LRARKALSVEGPAERSGGSKGGGELAVAAYLGWEGPSRRTELVEVELDRSVLVDDGNDHRPHLCYVGLVSVAFI